MNFILNLSPLLSDDNNDDEGFNHGPSSGADVGADMADANAFNEDVEGRGILFEDKNTITLMTANASVNFFHMSENLRI